MLYYSFCICCYSVVHALLALGVETLTAYYWVVVVSSWCYYTPVQFQYFIYFGYDVPTCGKRVSYSTVCMLLLFFVYVDIYSVEARVVAGGFSTKKMIFPGIL